MRTDFFRGRSRTANRTWHQRAINERVARVAVKNWAPGEGRPPHQPGTATRAAYGQNRLRLLLLSRGVPAQSSVRCRASLALRDFGTSAADFLPVQKGPETVGLDGDDAVAAVCVRFGGFVTFSCPLSRLAAVQGSSLIVSLPRAPGPPSKRPTPAIHLGRTVPISKQDIQIIR